MADCTEVIITGENKRLDTKEDVVKIIEQIKASPDMSILKLSGNSYGPDAATVIGETLSSVGRGLRHALWSDMFVSRLKTEIPPALTSLGNGLITAGTRLVELDLSDNAFGPTGVEGVVTLLTSEVCYTLKILKFNNNGLGIGGGKMLSNALLTCHQQASESGGKFALEVFQSGRNRLENAGALSLAEVFETLGTLVELSLPQNGIYHEGISALANALHKNTNLKVLNLSDNTLTEEGSLAIAGIVPSLQELEIINFDECLVRSNGAVAIATALKDGHPKLKELRLGYNELNIEAGSAIISALRNKGDLTVLNLNGNSFGEVGVERLHEMMTANGLEDDVLQSLSDDEGDSDGESDGESEGEGESEVTTNNKENINIQEQSINIHDWVSAPSKESLLSLGKDRIQLLQEYLTNTPSIHTLVEVYAKVAIGYHLTDEHSAYRQAVHEFIDKCCEPHLRESEHQMVTFINELLSMVGLIKNEDKSFKPLPDINGPLLVTAKYLSKQSYFPSKCHDILIAFFAKPCDVGNFTELRPLLLSALHS